ncbi:MAG: potassium-transporting ATPase subunit F [Saprospiraceae bacterium]|nr:potassium-transporting ATPase subunit F [Saprospiraceae bacterium]
MRHATHPFVARCRTLLLLALLPQHRCFRQHVTHPLAMLILFLIALLVFGYLVYVLLKPENF